MIGGCSKVRQDLPPFMLADGNPAETVTINKVGLERNGLSNEAINALRAGSSARLFLSSGSWTRS